MAEDIIKVIVIGLGSMGKRRIRLIKQIDENVDIVGVDSRTDRREETEEKYQIRTAENIEAALSILPGISCAVISTSPLSHAAIINECLIKGLNVFTELNLVPDRYVENMELASQKGLVLFMSSTFLYRDEIKYIQSQVHSCTSAVNYSYHVGQYLPDWHPWEDYKSFFVGDKKTNGCRELMAIEFPWLIKTFGNIQSFTVLGSKMSSLEIGYPDNYQILLEHEGGVKGTLQVDVVSRKAVRNLEVFGEDLYLSWDGSATGLQEYNIDTKEAELVELYNNVDHQKGYSAFVVENAYKSELEAFIDTVQHGSKPVYGFNDDLKTLQLIDSIENQVSANGS